MKHYLFFVNQPYSFAVLRPLQQEIWNRGDDVAWYFNGCSADNLADNEKQLDSVRAVKAYNPVAVFAPGTWIPDFFPGIKVHVFHGFSINKRGSGTEETSTHYRIRGLFDLYCTQAEKDTRMFQSIADQKGYFRVAKTGWPKLDTLFNSSPADYRLPNIPSDRPVILYASTFSRKITSAPYLVNTIAQMAETSGWHFLVTLHPKMDSQVVQQYRSLAGPNLTFHESDQDILPLLHTADAMLCDTSSIMFEFMLLDKPVVAYKTSMPGDYLIDVDNPAAIQPALEKALTRPEPLMNSARDFCRQLHEFTDGRSSARVLDAVDEHLKHHAHTLKHKPLNLVRRLKMRQRMGYYWPV